MLSANLPPFLSPLLRPGLGLVLAFAFAFAPSAHAGDLQLGVTLSGKKGQLSLQVGQGYANGRVLSGRRYPLPQRGQRIQRGCESHTRCLPARRFVPGHYKSVERQVWVPERKEKVWIPPVYQTRYDPCGRPYQVLVSAGRWDVICHPGYFETRCEQVWVPGRYATSCSTY